MSLTKYLATAALVLMTPLAARADHHGPTHVPADPAAQRMLLEDSVRAQRAAAVRIQRTSRDLKSSERELRSLQIQLDRTSVAYNDAVTAQRMQRARELDRRLGALRERADAAEARRDLHRAHLDLLRADYRRAAENVYTASGRARANGRG